MHDNAKYCVRAYVHVTNEEFVEVVNNRFRIVAASLGEGHMQWGYLRALNISVCLILELGRGDLSWVVGAQEFILLFPVSFLGLEYFT